MASPCHRLWFIATSFWDHNYVLSCSLYCNSATVQHCNSRLPVHLHFSASLSQSLAGEPFWNNNCSFLWKWNDFAVSRKICLVMSCANKISTARGSKYVIMFVLSEYGKFTYFIIYCGSHHGVIWFFHWHNPSGRIMVLGSTQSLTEMSTRNVSWV
jgi:hypothetical protein